MFCKIEIVPYHPDWAQKFEEEATKIKHVPGATCLVPFKYHLRMILLSLIFYSPCHAFQSKVPDEAQIIEYILDEGKKKENQRNKSVLMLIRDFAYQKLRDYAKKDKEFAKELIFYIPEDLDIQY